MRLNSIRRTILQVCSGVVLILAVSAFTPKPLFDPPFSGTIFIDPDIITSSDATAFEGITYTGRGQVTMYDRGPEMFVQNNAFLFQATFDDGLTARVQVNSEFGSESAAMVEASRYALETGRLPTSLRTSMAEIWIHKGTKPFGGGNESILIHTGQSALYIRDGILEETLVHEASHTSLDAAHANDADWLAAQSADPEFISTYARDNPLREDIAESFLTYLAVRIRPDRISSGLKQTIEQAIPNRLAYFDQMQPNLHPMVTATSIGEAPELPQNVKLGQNHPNPFTTTTTIPLDMSRPSHVSVTITNVLGQPISTLVDGFLEAGNHRVEWDGKDRSGNSVPNGTYLYTVSTPDLRFAKKMVLVN